MKYLVLGSQGMVGHTVALYLKEQGHEVVGFARRQSALLPTVIGDARETDNLAKIIKEGNYNSVVNCIGLLKGRAEKNKGEAVFLNAYLPHFLADVTNGTEINVIHISTDCVFSGDNGPYKENDLRNGTNFYDRTKALGELEDGKNLTLRCSVVGPDMKKDGKGLFNWFMQQPNPKGYTNIIWSGVTTPEIAKIIETASRERAHGLYNMVYKEPISKCDLLRLFNKYMCNNEINITADDSVVVNKSLIRTNFDFAYEVPDYETMVREMAEWIVAHKDLYPHYF